MVLNLGSLQNSHEGRISCLGLSADGSALCTGSSDSNLKVSVLFNLVFLLHFHMLLHPPRTSLRFVGPFILHKH